MQLFETLRILRDHSFFKLKYVYNGYEKIITFFNIIEDLMAEIVMLKYTKTVKHMFWKLSASKSQSFEVKLLYYRCRQHLFHTKVW